MVSLDDDIEGIKRLSSRIGKAGRKTVCSRMQLAASMLRWKVREGTTDAACVDLPAGEVDRKPACVCIAPATGHEYGLQLFGFVEEMWGGPGF